MNPEDTPDVKVDLVIYDLTSSIDKLRKLALEPANRKIIDKNMGRIAEAQDELAGLFDYLIWMNG